MKIRGMGGWWVRVDTTQGFTPGSYWTLQQINNPPPNDQLVLTPVSGTGLLTHNAEYEIVTEVEIRQTRSTGCGGWTEGLPKFRKVELARFKVSEDDVSYPQVLGWTEGAEVSCFLKRGQLIQWDLLDRTVVKSVRVFNDQQKARWVEVVCQHGRYVRGVPANLITEQYGGGGQQSQSPGQQGKGEGE